ncbi:bile acid:sodium symporter family protein [Nocardiopsis sp. RSe5-2]|uniref:Bile acid:sodium symporter family protein n=1 Tax=Nocardiopsis endophytica TaxID=3018445 RepID=A0ABT4U146_9ACTN|nr:bile acid:sodium symporter family protein [Nocardiopsis endophytica]MDA2810669.1 bile acid:sodium symporter family protein [Nocardiopsis endophytica]
MALLERVASFVGRWFALLVLAGAVVGMLVPEQSAALAPHIALLLGVIMFGMGLTMQPVDFAIVAKHPKAVLLGVAAQYVVMPLLGFGIAQLFGFEPLLVVGMVLVGASPGGTASNVIVYLARGDVALSVAMTSLSTLLAPVLTPLLVLGLAGSTLPVSAGDLFVSILEVVLVPVLLGLVVRALARRLVLKVLPVLPLVSVGGIVVVVAAVVGANAGAVASTGLLLGAAVVLHNVCGLALGYGVGRVTGLPESARRAVAIEVGMQNSGLASALATAHFAPLAALPGALFSVWHNMSGALAATLWARRPTGEDAAEGAGAAPPAH